MANLGRVHHLRVHMHHLTNRAPYIHGGVRQPTYPRNTEKNIRIFLNKLKHCCYLVVFNPLSTSARPQH